MEDNQFLSFQIASDDEDFLDNDDELLIANSDQIIEYSKYNFNTLRRYTNFDGIVFAFNAVHPKWSFVKVNSRGVVTEVAEKKPISDIATCVFEHPTKSVPITFFQLK